MSFVIDAEIHAEEPNLLNVLKNNVKFFCMNEILIFLACPLFQIWQMAINIFNFIDNWLFETVNVALL